MIGTQDLEKRIVTFEDVFLILMIGDVEPQHDHGGAEVDAPRLETAVDQGMA